MPTKYRRPSPPLKWHGGKHYLAPKIVALMTRCRTYVEPYAGGLSVLLARDPDNTSEIVNDLNGDLSNFWKVMADPGRFAKFVRRIEGIPMSEVVWNACHRTLAKFHRLPRGSPEAGELLQEYGGLRVGRAVCFFVVCRQSLAGRMDSFAPITQNRLRRRMNEQASAWLSAVEGLPMVHERLKRVLVLNQEATKVIQKFDGPDVVMYLDPPYPSDTRVSPDVYAEEMTRRQHQELLDVLVESKSNILLSSYPNELYDRRLKDWTQHRFDLPNNASGKRSKDRKQEVVYTNF